MFKKNRKLLLLALFQVFALLSFPAVALAAPAKCIIYNTGGDILSSGDDSHTLVNCESSDYANLRNFEDDKYYQIDVTPVTQPAVSEITEENYLRRADIINGGTGELPDEQSGDFTADCKVPKGGRITKNNCGIVAYIVLFTRVLSGVVGIVVVIMIAVGGIQYATARDDPQAVATARTRIRNAVLALVFYLVSIAFLQWLVPGGIF